jgi:hypothetical protein
VVEQFRIVSATSTEEAERQVNELAARGYEFVQMSASPDRIYIVLEDIGGNAGTIDSEALQAGIPSQGPTAERQLTESVLGSGAR